MASFQILQTTRKKNMSISHFTRSDGRLPDTLRPVSFIRNYTKYAEGSVLSVFGETKVICTATIENSVPGFLKGRGRGWLTAEYGMLPRSTHTRMDREAIRGRPSGRTQEIQRLIGRSLRTAFDLNAIGERTIHLDCDVIQADGGTRTAAICGAMIAAYDAFEQMVEEGDIDKNPLRYFVAAISIGIHHGIPLLDLNYEEDNACDADVNAVMTETRQFVEIQGTAEGDTFDREMLKTLLDMSEKGILELIDMQKAVLGLANI